MIKMKLFTMKLKRLYVVYSTRTGFNNATKHSLYEAYKMLKESK